MKKKYKIKFDRRQLNSLYFAASLAERYCEQDLELLNLDVTSREEVINHREKLLEDVIEVKRLINDELDKVDAL